MRTAALIALLLIALLVFTGMLIAVIASMERLNQCERSGGQMVQTDRGRVCLKATMLKGIT
jgi:hypothetical protein